MEHAHKATIFEDEGMQESDVVCDLHKIMREAVESEIHVDVSFFNIYGAGSGISKHEHINRLDRIPHLNLGTKNTVWCTTWRSATSGARDPGVLKFYAPLKNIYQQPVRLSFSRQIGRIQPAMEEKVSESL